VESTSSSQGESSYRAALFSSRADNIALFHSYGILCSDFKTSGLAAEEKENSKPAAAKNDKGKAKDLEKGKGKGKANEEGDKPKTKKKKPKGLFAIDWFRIGTSLKSLLQEPMLMIRPVVLDSSRRSSSNQVSNDVECESELRSQRCEEMGSYRYPYRQVRCHPFFLRTRARYLLDLAHSRLEDLYSLLHFIQLEPWGEPLSSSSTGF
jgi:DNA repair protein RAD5